MKIEQENCYTIPIVYLAYLMAQDTLERAGSARNSWEPGRRPPFSQGGMNDV
jgi:hypothetical protein